jgi:hypothetical protein
MDVKGVCERLILFYEAIYQSQYTQDQKTNRHTQKSHGDEVRVVMGRWWYRFHLYLLLLMTMKKLSTFFSPYPKNEKDDV